MKAIAPAVFYALFVWWFTTGLVLLLVVRERLVRASLIGAALLFPLGLCLLAVSSAYDSLASVYLAFTAAILVWAALELGFLAGAITGPRSLPCPPDATGLARLRHALGAVLYHELALALSAAAVLAVTWHAPNQSGAMTFFVLWIMRVSAELNLFLGVPVLNDELMPPAMLHLRSYFRRGPVNGFWPVAVLMSVLALGVVIAAAADPLVKKADEVGYALVAALLGLAILEHVFMVVPLPVDRLWRWAAGGAPRQDASASTRIQQRSSSPDRTVGRNEIERVAITSP